MAYLKKLKENGRTFYPTTVAEGVIIYPTKPTDASGATVDLSTFIDKLLYFLGGERSTIEATFTNLKNTLGIYNLNTFLAKVDTILFDGGDSDEIINKWQEIEAFLTGITDSQTLTGLLNGVLEQAKDYTDSTETALSGDIDALSSQVSNNEDSISALETDMYDEDGKVGKLSKPATTTTNGLMSAADKAKLDDIAANANNYKLPIASDTVLGGVKSGGDAIIDGQGRIYLNEGIVSMWNPASDEEKDSYLIESDGEQGSGVGRTSIRTIDLVLSEPVSDTTDYKEITFN